MARFSFEPPETSSLHVWPAWGAVLPTPAELSAVVQTSARSLHEPSPPDAGAAVDVGPGPDAEEVGLAGVLARANFSPATTGAALGFESHAPFVQIEVQSKAE